VRKYVIAAEQRARIMEIGSLAQRLQNENLTAEQRKEVEAALDKARQALEKQIQFDEKSIDESIERARIQRSESQRLLAESAAAWRTQGRHSVRVGGAPVPLPPPTPQVAGVGDVKTTPVTPGMDVKAVVGVKTEKPKPEARTASGSAGDVKKAPAKEVAKTTAKEPARDTPKASLIFGREFNAKVKKEGALVGEVTARISEEEVVQRVLSTPTDDGSEIPFAVDREGNVYTRDPASRRTLEGLGVAKKITAGIVPNDIAGWIVSASTDKQSGLRIGVARPVGENLESLRRSATNNFSIGLGLIVCAMLGIVPLANHLTRDVELVTRGAERIAQGDLMTRLPVRSKNEFGQLSQAFNRMAEDLSVQQQQIVEQERARQAQELEQQLLAAEYQRKSVELEDARRFQLSLLPKEVPDHKNYEVAVYTRTATEVGGDYYDFQISEGGVMSVAIGDATGHGAKAGTMVTVVKTLFTAYEALRPPREFLRDAAEKIKRMELGRMSMSLTLARFDHDQVTVAAAGMPPVYVHRAATGMVEEYAQEATPLGTIATAYDDVVIAIEPGDTVLFMT
ncbi:MAG: SpoIIE family protein phosphatase, partial [Thermoanaerobaculia bacterium]